MISELTNIVYGKNPKTLKCCKLTESFVKQRYPLLTTEIARQLLKTGWSEQMSDTMEKRTKIYKKHCFGYMKKFIPWRYVLLYLCEN